MVFQLLTDRQGEYLRRFCAGESDREIADAMRVGVPSLGPIRANIRLRLKDATMQDICRMVSEQESLAPVLSRPISDEQPIRTTGRFKRTKPAERAEPWTRYPKE